MGLSRIGSFLVLEPGEMAQVPTSRWSWWAQLCAARLTPVLGLETNAVSCSVAEVGRGLFRETEMKLAEMLLETLIAPSETIL